MIRLVCMALALMTLLLIGGVARAADPAPSHAESARVALDHLKTALDDGARGRPVEARLRSIVRRFDDLLLRAPLSDRDRARIHYNRGLANLALGDHAAAIVDLRRSDHLAPGREATQRELHTARAGLNPVTPPASAPGTTPAPATGLTSPTEPTPRQFTPTLRDQAWNLVLRVDPRVRFQTGLAAFSLLWVGVGLWLICRRPLRTMGPPLAISAACIAAAGLGSLWLQHRLRPGGGSAQAVVMSDDCRVLRGPDDLAYDSSTLGGQSVLPRGSELDVLEARAMAGQPEGTAAAFLRVRLSPTGSLRAGAMPAADSAWIAASAVEWIGEPPETTRSPAAVPASPGQGDPPPPQPTDDEPDGASLPVAAHARQY